MKQLTCEMCGSTDLMKQDGVFVCQSCGCKYSVEEAKKMMVEGTVDVQGTVKVDNSSFVAKYLANARRAKDKEDWEETEKYYNMVEQNDPTNIEAIFYSAFARVKQALLEAETAAKRQGVFKVLVKSVSVIDDNFDNANAEHHKLLPQIMDDIKGLKKGAIVPTTHLQDYVKKDGFKVVDRSQLVENDSLDVTYEMIDDVFDAYMDSLANIIIEYPSEPIKKLFVDNVNDLSAISKVHEKVAPYIDGYKTPQQACAEIVEQVELNGSTKIAALNKQINELGKTVCPMFMSGEKVNASFRKMVLDELKRTHPYCNALYAGEKSDGCYVATAVYGSYDCPQVWTLRRYRDYTLAETWYGRAFIRTYYAISPTLVKWFGHTEWFKKMWKGKLDSMVANLKAEGVEDTPYQDINWQCK